MKTVPFLQFRIWLRAPGLILTRRSSDAEYLGTAALQSMAFDDGVMMMMMMDTRFPRKQYFSRSPRTVQYVQLSLWEGGTAGIITSIIIP